MSQLPIVSVLPELLDQLKIDQQVILKAPPGAGKSTLLPLKVMKQEWLSGKIVMLEPRRLAAKNIAHYLASQLNEEVGESIGYRIKGESITGGNTKLEVVTEGIMTRMIQSDPELTGIDLLIFDEFHERSIHADTSLAFSLEVQQAFRDDLKLLIMSATLDQEALTSLLPEASYVESKGRSFAVEKHYSPLKVNERLNDAINRAIRHALQTELGSILVFLPGVKAIKQLQTLLGTLSSEVDVQPLYGQLSFLEQQKAIMPTLPGRRKIVLATNIAETSLTIEGIRVVIDSGLERVARFDLKSGITRLEEVRIAQSSAEQRAGRAGRIEDGICVRMYSKEQFKLFAKVPEAEILHSDLSPLCMELAQWGVRSIEELRWLDQPPSSAINQGFNLLAQLGLTSKKGQITEKGNQAAKLAIDSRLATMLIKTRTKNSAAQSCALCLAVLIEEGRLINIDLSQAVSLIKSNQFAQQHLIEKRIALLARKLGYRYQRENIDESFIGVCLAMAYPDRIGKNRQTQAGTFLLANGHGCFIDTNETMSDCAYIIAVDLIRTQQQQSRVLLAAQVDIKQLQHALPDLIDKQEWVEWDEVKGRLVAELQYNIGKLIVHREALPKPDKRHIHQALLNHVKRKGLQCLSWEKTDQALLERYRCGSEWFPEKSWPPLTQAALLDNIEEWLVPFMTHVDSLKLLQKVNLSQAISAYVGWPLNQEIDVILPTHYLLPSGNKKKINYQLGKEPSLSVRMQEVFGEQASPVIANGKKTVVLELLSPAQRPLQITSDLAGFWSGAYKEVQKEMKGRYPKHVWPDDPANHIATTKTKRQLNS